LTFGGNVTLGADENLLLVRARPSRLLRSGASPDAVEAHGAIPFTQARIWRK
jgi:hypothetical protein